MEARGLCDYVVLIDEVQLMIVERKIRFLLTGSSGIWSGDSASASPIRLSRRRPRGLCRYIHFSGMAHTFLRDSSYFPPEWLIPFSGTAHTFLYRQPKELILNVPIISNR